MDGMDEMDTESLVAASEEGSFGGWTPPEAEPRSRHIPMADGFALHAVEWPSRSGAPTLLMLHGRRAHARWFDSVVDHFSPEYRMICPDLRGHGDSTCEGTFGFEDHARDMAHVAESVRSEGGPLIVVAHSMAGRILLLAHSQFGMRPDLLVMVDTPLHLKPRHMRPEPEFKPKRYPTKEDAIQRFRLLPDGDSAHPELLRHVAEKGVKQNEDGTWSWKFESGGVKRPPGFRIPAFEELPIQGITCPTLVLYGEYSALVEHEDAHETAARFPKGRPVCLRGTHHHLMLDDPAGFSEKVKEFIATEIASS